MRAVLTLGALCAFFVSGGAWAAYANASPPAGWSMPAAGATTERGMYRAAANELWTSAQTVRTTATLNVGGRAVSMPAGMRMAANAGRFAARFAWTNPILFAAGAIALPLALDWFQQNSYRFNTDTNQWETLREGQVCTSGCLEYQRSTQYSNGAWTTSLAEACATYNQLSGYPSSFQSVISYTEATCNMVWSYNGAVYTQTVPKRTIPPYDTRTYGPASQAEMEAKFDPLPVPQNVANELAGKGAALPVGLPSLNPSPDPAMAPQTLRVPLGDPYPVPNTSPQKYSQPVVDVKPSPTVLEPWRVDAKPLDITSEDPTGVTQPTTAPSGTTTAVVTPKDEPTPGLCEQFPDILACQQLGTPPEAEPVKSQEVAVSMTPSPGWNLGTNACPAPRSVSLAGGSYEFSFQALCDFASGIRPVIVGMAYLSALLAFFGFARRAT